jgi:hypothetical protein
MLLLMVVSALAAVPPGIAVAQDASAMSPSIAAAPELAAVPIPTPAVADSTRVATAAAVQNSLQTAQQVLQQGQALQFQLQQQSAYEQFRALNRR